MHGAYDGRLDLILPCKGQLCTELRWDQIAYNMIILSYPADDVGHLKIQFPDLSIHLFLAVFYMKHHFVKANMRRSSNLP